MLKLKRVTLRHWQRVRQATVEFPTEGLVLVQGNNLSNVGKFLSIGSGKTSMGEAIARALLGVDGKYSNYGYYSTDEQGDTYVKVEAELRGRELIVEQGWKCAELSPTGEGLRFQYDGVVTELSHIDKTRAALTALIGVSAELASWSVFLDGEQLKFNKLSQAKSVELLMQALAQPNWDACKIQANDEHKRLKEVFARAQEKLTVAQAECFMLDSRIKEAKENVERAKLADAEAEAGRARMMADATRKYNLAAQETSTITAELKTLRKEIDKVVATADVEYKKAEIEASQIFSQLTTARSYYDGWRDEVNRLTPLYRDSYARHEDLKTEYNGICARCKQPLPNRPSLAEVTKAKSETAKLSADLASAKAQLELSRTDVSEAEKSYEAARSKVRKNSAAQTSALSKKYEDRELDLEDAKQDADNLRKTLDLIVENRVELKTPAAVAVLQERERSKVTTKEAVETCARELADAETELAYMAYWLKAFSPTGIPNMVLRQAIQPLNEAARLTSLTMTGGAIDVAFSATTELASGAEKPQLVTKIDNKFGASRFQGNSKGEAGLANLILAETQTTVGRLSKRISWRWFDEVINTQDPQVFRNVYQYLRQQAEAEKLLIFVVDHHPEAAHYAHHVLIAEKSAEGDTTYYWQNK